MGLLNHSGLRRNIHRDLEFELLDKHGFPVKHRGAYVCTDGGYRKLVWRLCPTHHSTAGTQKQTKRQWQIPTFLYVIDIDVQL